MNLVWLSCFTNQFSKTGHSTQKCTWCDIFFNIKFYEFELFLKLVYINKCNRTKCIQIMWQSCLTEMVWKYSRFQLSFCSWRVSMILGQKKTGGISYYTMLNEQFLAYVVLMLQLQKLCSNGLHIYLKRLKKNQKPESGLLVARLKFKPVSSSLLCCWNKAYKLTRNFTFASTFVKITEAEFPKFNIDIPVYVTVYLYNKWIRPEMHVLQVHSKKVSVGLLILNKCI